MLAVASLQKENSSSNCPMLAVASFQKEICHSHCPMLKAASKPKGNLLLTLADVKSCLISNDYSVVVAYSRKFLLYCRRIFIETKGKLSSRWLMLGLLGAQRSIAALPRRNTAQKPALNTPSQVKRGRPP